MKYCFPCPVRKECKDYQKRTKSIGVWGGDLVSAEKTDGVGGGA